MIGKDYTGMKFNLLTFVGKSDKRVRNNVALWELRCDCSAIIYSIPHVVVRGHKKSCGCQGQPNKRDWTGVKVGRLTFVEPTEERNGAQRVVWIAICECGNTHRTVPQSSYGGAQSCGCKATEARQECGRKNRKYDPLISSARAVWSGRYRDCDFDTFYRLSQLPCDYCGREPFRVWNFEYGTSFTYNGLDRVDSTKGHTEDNIVPCCADCNWMKSNRTRSEFITHISRIFTHSNK